MGCVGGITMLPSVGEKGYLKVGSPRDRRHARGPYRKLVRGED